MDAADCRLVAGVAEWLFGEVLLDVRFFLVLFFVRMEVASSRPDHLPTLSIAKTSELSLLIKSLRH